MGYDQKKVQADIDETIALYRKHWKDSKGREIIVRAYHNYPNDYWIMHYYMWNIAGDLADNDPAVLVEHKDEFLSICEKILGGCTEDALRLSAWNMRAKILHAEGKTGEALRIYQTKFADWFTTSGQKTEQLFAKDTSEYYFHVRKNMYELGDFAADKLGRTVFFDPLLSMAEKTERAILYGDLMLNAYRETKEAFFLMLAESFLGRMENDICYRGGTDDQIIAVMDKNLYAKKLLEEAREKNEPLNRAFDRYSEGVRQNILKYNIDYRADATDGRRAELLKNPVSWTNTDNLTRKKQFYKGSDTFDRAGKRQILVKNFGQIREKTKTAPNRVLFLFWLRRQDLNLRPSGYEPDELPGCSTPRYYGAGNRA